jgi:hypothetical protein
MPSARQIEEPNGGEHEQNAAGGKPKKAHDMENLNIQN